MSRTPVGLANHPATKFNWQLPVANGCLIKQPVLAEFVCGSAMGVNQQTAPEGCSGLMDKTNPEIAELGACRLAICKAIKQ